ncbi:MAG TPA: excinuclease ABC subunit UvrC [Candidatus Cloacimonadota bacterium]|nr:excinuclease ABC subunit UvrC [Candidatus Cloacimonadota bacterium]HPS37988.1 excinuclease ABC subunit UvrC [Candidatus Cloacimonadota bacterium]
MEQIPQKIKDKLSFLPEDPGIYLWKDSSDTIIYVGKALNLHNRIKSYVSGTAKDPKTEQLVRHIADLDYIITNTEAEAFILEANLIKKHKPKYNILLKDDKRYPHVKITLAEPFPRILVTRDLPKDGSSYFGPFTDVKSLRRTLRTFEWIFPLRTCSRIIPADKIKFKTACINYQLGKCPAPCVGYISQADYGIIVRRLLNFFKGRYQEIGDELREEMLLRSQEMNYETAAKLRDQIIALENIQKRQAVSQPDDRNLDIIGFYQEENLAVVVILRMINGKILLQENYPLTNIEQSTREQSLSAFIKLYYSDREELPNEILLPFTIDDIEEISSWLTPHISVPQKGEKTKLLMMAKRNAFHLIEERKLSHMRKANRTIFPIQELKEKLKLPKLPRKIVCMDISTIQGTDTVSSAVYFENGKTKKKFYRHFIIRSIDTQNDFAAMSETMTRFLAEIDKDKEMEPDLFIIDGGKGQLGVSYAELSASSYAHIPIISLAKRIEEIYLPDSNEPVILPRSASSLRLITTIRDEAHRFAINFHRSRRSKRTLISELEDIQGIGEQSKFLLLKALGSVESIRNATIDELQAVKGIGLQTAEKIHSYFHPDETDVSAE